MSSAIFSVKYLTNILDKCSLKLFGHDTDEFIEMHFPNIFWIIEKNKENMNKEKYLEIIKNFRNNQFNLLNFFEYIKNLRNYLETNMENEFNSIKEEKTNKSKYLIDIEDKLNFTVKNLKLKLK